MGMFKERVKVINLKNENLFFENDFWVDSGALYSFIPEEYLEKIKVEPMEKRNIILADGRTDTKLFGFCSVADVRLRRMPIANTNNVAAGVDYAIRLCFRRTQFSKQLLSRELSHGNLPDEWQAGVNAIIMGRWTEVYYRRMKWGV